MRVGEWWRWRRRPCDLYWLNTNILDGVGMGGRLYRNEAMRKKIEPLHDERGAASR